MKIVHAIARLNLGGAALSVLELAAGQQERGHEVLVVAGTIPPGEASMESVVAAHHHRVDFSSYGMSEGIVGLLQQVWDSETDGSPDCPNFARLAKDSLNNVRDALMSLETEILAA